MLGCAAGVIREVGMPWPEGIKELDNEGMSLDVWHVHYNL
jgi:hypothetical protein